MCNQFFFSPILVQLQFLCTSKTHFHTRNSRKMMRSSTGNKQHYINFQNLIFTVDKFISHIDSIFYSIFCSVNLLFVIIFIILFIKNLMTAIYGFSFFFVTQSKHLINMLIYAYRITDSFL